MKVEVETLFNSCSGCKNMKITEDHGKLRCVKMGLCNDGAQVLLKELQDRFEWREHEAYKTPSGLKEHATWNHAIRILEEYMDE